MTVAEVADQFKVNQQTVRNWIDQGRLPAVRVGRRVRIRRSDFDRILDGSERSNASPPSSARAGSSSGPSAQDFWSGEPVGAAEPDPSAKPEATPDQSAGPDPS
ncbi:MAG TPA: helix-turn-helix domain-containing protein [Solirubrobacteraceae bacterium]|nr:helix-turn-helix domain-containing protein [Solirubrobacteraceae bacterium]